MTGVFERQRGRATLGNAIVMVVGTGLVAGFLGGWVNVLLASSGPTDIIVLSVITPLRFVAGFLIAQGFLLASVRSMGARGEFGTQAYLSALVYAPLNTLALVLAIIPFVGGLFAVLVLIAMAGLTVPALYVAHGEAARHIPGIVLFLLALVGGALSWVAISSLAL